MITPASYCLKGCRRFGFLQSETEGKNTSDLLFILETYPNSPCLQDNMTTRAKFPAESERGRADLDEDQFIRKYRYKLALALFRLIG
jgi:hypothetical protein